MPVVGETSAVDGIFNPQKLVMPAAHQAGGMGKASVIHAPVIEIDDDELDLNKQALYL